MYIKALFYLSWRSFPQSGPMGVVQMEEGVWLGVQVEVGREEQGEGETHGKGQSEEQTRNKRSTAHHGWHEDGVTRACRHLSLGRLEP